MAILHQPHGVNKKLKRVSRLVILPDYQGIGLGTKFLNVVAEMYKRKGYDFTIVTSAKNMIHALRQSDKWIMTRYSANNCSSVKSAIDYHRSSLRSECKTGVQIQMTKKSASFVPSMRTQCKTARFIYK